MQVSGFRCRVSGTGTRRRIRDVSAGFLPRVSQRANAPQTTHDLEQGHADRIAGRITQLGGEPDFNPDGLASRSHSQYIEGATLVDMIQEDLVAERIAIESYGEIVRFLGDRDITSRRMMEEILEVEEEHADDLRDLLATLDPTRPAE